MNRKRFILLLMVVFAIQTVCVSAQKVTRTITDIETGLVVPFASIYKSDNSVVCHSNTDGVFSMEVDAGSTYTLSHISYKPITISANQLLSESVIKMEMISYELNPVVVTATTALKDIQRAIDTTHKHLPSTPFFLRCYRQEQIVEGDDTFHDTFLDAKALIDIRVLKVHAVGKGASINYLLKGTQIDKWKNESTDMPPTSPCPIISMNNGIQKTNEEKFLFTRIHSENDSITIIAYHPKKYYSGDVNPSGRYIIDTKTWRILRIDAMFDIVTIEILNQRVVDSDSKRFIYEVNRSIFFSAHGLPSKVEDKTAYFYKTDPEKLITWTVFQVYKDISKADYKQKPSGSYDQKKFVFQQKPIAIPDFDTQFSLGFQ